MDARHDLSMGRRREERTAIGSTARGGGRTWRPDYGSGRYLHDSLGSGAGPASGARHLVTALSVGVGGSRSSSAGRALAVGLDARRMRLISSTPFIPQLTVAQ